MLNCKNLAVCSRWKSVYIWDNDHPFSFTLLKRSTVCVKDNKKLTWENSQNHRLEEIKIRMITSTESKQIWQRNEYFLV